MTESHIFFNVNWSQKPSSLMNDSYESVHQLYLDRALNGNVMFARRVFATRFILEFPHPQHCNSCSLTQTMDLSPHLLEGTSYSAIHLRTNAYECKPLTISRKRPLTLKVKHLLLLSEKDTSHILLGIEVYVYLSFNGPELERHFFISKADTTGLSSRRISTAEVTKSFLKYLIQIDPNVYLPGATYRKVSRRKVEARIEERGAAQSLEQVQGVDENECASVDNCLSEIEIVQQLRALSAKLKKNPESLVDFLKLKSGHTNASSSELPVQMPICLNTKISLFTRPADAYLFPKSEKNKGKHLVDGNSLFKWWISILYGTLDNSWQCKADIPGSDRISVSKFIPGDKNWEIGNIYVTAQSKKRAVHTIPLFPDDPKGRFLEHLIVENRYKSVDSHQFWEELGFRQEFRLGNVVGIIGCSKNSPAIEGNPEESWTTILTPIQYRKMREQIKGEDYGIIDDVINLWKSGLDELARTLGTKLLFKIIYGSLPIKPMLESDLNTKKSAFAVHTLPTKRKAKTVNNLSGLIKRKK